MTPRLVLRMIFRPAFARRSNDPQQKAMPGPRAGGKPVSIPNRGTCCSGSCAGLARPSAPHARTHSIAAIGTNISAVLMNIVRMIRRNNRTITRNSAKPAANARITSAHGLAAAGKHKHDGSETATPARNPGPIRPQVPFVSAAPASRKQGVRDVPTRLVTNRGAPAIHDAVHASIPGCPARVFQKSSRWFSM